MGWRQPRSAVRRAVGFLLWVFLIQWGWEAVHAAAYVETAGPLSQRLLCCLPMGAVDAVWSLGLLVAARAIVRRAGQASPATSLWLMAVLGATTAAILEWYALRTGRWTYNALMPLIPGLRVGVSPVLQMAIVPIVAARLSGLAGRRGYKDALAEHTTATSEIHPHRGWRHAFMAADFVLIAAVSVGTAVVMSRAHDSLDGFWIPAIAGMTAGMAAGMALGFIVRPFLGSIETTIPVMLGGMASGMAVCLAMFVVHVDAASASALGLLVGALIHARLRRIEARMRREEAPSSGA